MKLKSIFFTFFIAIYLPLILLTKIPFLIKTLFTLNFLVLATLTYYYLYRDKKFAPILSSYIVFNFLFFLIAPMLQTHNVYDTENLNLPTKLVYRDYLIIKTNILVLLFNIVFFVFYRYFNAIKSKVIIYKKNKNLPFHIIIFFVISILIFILNFKHIQYEYLNSNYFDLESTSKSSLLIKEKIILMFPFMAFIMAIGYLRNKKKTKNYYYILFVTILLLTLVLLIKNPLTEKRNALGPIYITLIFLIIPRLLNTNFKILVFLFMSMIVVFPTISLITHSGYSLKQLINNPNLFLKKANEHGITNTFTSLNYDAFINFSGTIEYAEKNSLSYGKQLSGGLFFFVPRKIWENKPISSGEFIGNYLRDTYGNKYSFTNLSNPYVSEGYLNFGILGVIMFAIFLAFFMSRMTNWVNGDNQLKKAASFYAAIHLIFFLRGDFTNGFAFLFATFIVVLLIPKIYFSLFKRVDYESIK